MPPERITGRVERLDELAGEVEVGRALVVDLRRARVEGDAGDAGLVDEPVRRARTPSRSPFFVPLRSLTVTGRPEPSRAARATATAVSGSLSIAAPAPVLHDLRHRAAHVQVDEVGAGALGDVGGGAAHDVGVLAEELDRDRPALRSSGCDAQHLGARLLVAVVDPEARDHLRHRQPRAVALGLQAHEPVADARQRREHDAVGDRRVPPSSPAVGERRERTRPRGVDRASHIGGSGSEFCCRLRSWSRRRPVSVSRSSTSSMCSVNGTMCSARPPVAMTSTSSLPSSALDAADDPVDRAGVAVDDAGADRVDGRLADRRRAAARGRSSAASRRAR